MQIKLQADRPTPQAPTTTRCACSPARSSTPRGPVPQKASTAPHQCSSGVLFPKESFIPLLPAWCLSCLSALVWQACVAERPRFGARWARPITPEPAAAAAGSRARLRRSSCRAVRRPATGQQQEQEQMLGARTSMQPRSARSGSSSSRRRRSRAQSVASVPIARVASFSSSSSSAGRRRQQQQQGQQQRRQLSDSSSSRGRRRWRGRRCSRGRRARIRAAAAGDAAVPGRWPACRSRASPASAAAAAAAQAAQRQQQQQQQREAVGAVGDDVAAVSAAGLGKQQMARHPSALNAQPTAFVRRPVVLYCTSLALYHGAARERQRLAAALNECPPSTFVTPLLAACRARSGGLFCVPIVLTIRLSRRDALQSWASQKLAGMSSPQVASAPSRLWAVGR